MLAALITGTGRVDVRDFADPTPAEGGVVVDISFCGICGTDVHAFTSGRAYTPAICGHEWTGTISAVGRSVSRLSEADRVVVAVPPACGSCPACRAGNTGHCEVTLAFARGRDADAPPHGGFAPRIAVSADRVVAAHPDLADETLAQVEPVTVSLHAVNQSGIRDGDTAVVQGAGPVGLTTMQCARAAGAGRIVVVEPSDVRRDAATALGATYVTSPESANEFVRDHTGGLGADIVYECAGGADTLQSAVGLARRGGTVSLIGMADGSVEIDPGVWLRQEITVRAALAYEHDEFEQSMALLADGSIRVDLIHTATTQIGGLASTLENLAGAEPSQMKVLVNPNW